MNTTNDRIIIGIDPGPTSWATESCVSSVTPRTDDFGRDSIKQIRKSLSTITSHFRAGLRPHRTISSRRDGYRSSILRKERAIHAETRTSARSRYGSRALPRHSHYRIRPIKNQNVDYRKRKCIERTSRRHVTAHSAYPR